MESKERKDDEGRHKDRAEAQLRNHDMEREASAIFAALFEKDNKSSRLSTEDESESSSRPLTAANLIDVIITRSINQPMLDSQDQGTDSDSGDGMSIGRSMASSKEKSSKSVSDSDSLQQENGDNNAVPSSSTERSLSAAKEPNQSKSMKEAAGEQPERSQESLVPVSSPSPLPITLAEHIDTIISMDYNKVDQTSQVMTSASTSAQASSALSKRERGKASGGVDTSESHQQGPSSSSPRSRYRVSESEVGSTNDAARRSSPVASSLQSLHGSRSSSTSDSRMRSQGSMSYSGATDPVINSSKDSSPRSRAASTASDISSASASPANARPDSYSNRVSSQWGSRKDLEGSSVGRVSRSSSEQSREASPVSIGEMTAPLLWQRKYQQEGNGVDSSENASRGSQQRFRVHSSQSTSPQQPESWVMADSNRPPSRGRRRESPKTIVEPGSSSSSLLDAASSSEDRTRFTSGPVESAVSDSQRQLSSSQPDTKSRSEAESSRSGNPAPQSTSHEYTSDGSLQPADSMSQMRQCLSRSPKHGQPGMMPSSSLGRQPQRKDANLFKFDLQKSIDRMIESQVRMETPVRMDTQVRMDDYVTRLVEAEMSSSRSSPQRCDSRESTSTAESGGLEVDESRLSDVSDLDNHEAESVPQPSVTQQRPHGTSPRLSVRDSGEVEVVVAPSSVPNDGTARLTVGSSSGASSNRSSSVTSPNMAAQQADQPSQSVPTSSSVPVSIQQGFPSSATGPVGNQFAYSALSFRSAAAAAAASSSTPNVTQNHLNNPHRRNPSPHLGPVRGPSPVPGPGIAGVRDREPAPLLSSQYETLSDSD